jgi:hypothetical protein
VSASATPRAAGTRRAPFVAVVLVLLAAGLVGQLLLNTSLQRGSFELYELQSAQSDLADEQQRLEQELAWRESPAALAARARLLGMVASGTPVFLHLDDGTVSGTPTPAPAPPAPLAPPEPQPEPEPTPAPVTSDAPITALGGPR